MAERRSMLNQQTLEVARLALEGWRRPFAPSPSRPESRFELEERFACWSITMELATESGLGHRLRQAKLRHRASVGTSTSALAAWTAHWCGRSPRIQLGCASIRIFFCLAPPGSASFLACAGEKACRDGFTAFCYAVPRNCFAIWAGAARRQSAHPAVGWLGWTSGGRRLGVAPWLMRASGLWKSVRTATNGAR